MATEPQKRKIAMYDFMYALHRQFSKQEVLGILEPLMDKPNGLWDLQHIAKLPETWTAQGLAWSLGDGRLQFMFVCHETGNQFLGPAIPIIELSPSEEYLKAILSSEKGKTDASKSK